MGNIARRIDASGILDRRYMVQPFLLVNAHASRLSLEILRYINSLGAKSVLVRFFSPFFSLDERPF